MIRDAVSALALAAALSLGGPASLGTGPALAQACLSQSDTRAAVESGQVIALSSVLGQIRDSVGGEILSSPALCTVGGRLVYLVNVLVNGQVTRLQIDAQTGAISY